MEGKEEKNKKRKEIWFLNFPALYYQISGKMEFNYDKVLQTNNLHKETTK